MTFGSFVSKRSLAAGALVAAFCGVPAFADHSWGGYHWARQSNPFRLKVGDNVNTAWDGTLLTTVGDWTGSSVLDLLRVDGISNPKNCRPTGGMVQVCNSTYGNTGWLGVAQVWVNGLHITQGTVKLNDTYFRTPAYDTPAWRNLVSCQEVGHTLGLDHQDENFNNTNLGTCMDYTSNPESNQHPNQHDYDQLVTIYSHLDSTTTVSSASAAAAQPPAMSSIDLSGPGQWGRLVKSSATGRHEVFELDFGGGHKVFTFVTWVEGSERGRGQ